MSPKKHTDEEVVGQLGDDLLEFLTQYSEHINVHSPDVQLKIEELAEAAVESMSDYEDEEEEDSFLEYHGDMDQYGDDDDD
jgi:hypothetical protein